MKLKTLLISTALCLLSLPGKAAVFTYPATTYIDDTGAKVTPTSVTVASITTKAGLAISGATATANIAGSNASVDYDAALYGEAWITLTPVLSGHTFVNNPPVAFGSLDSGNVQLIKAASVVGTGTVTSATTPSTTSFSTTLTSATDLISGDGGVWTSGVNAGKVFHVFTNSAGLFTVAGTGLPAAPSAGDAFVLYPFSKPLVASLAALGPDSKPLLSSSDTQAATEIWSNSVRSLTDKALFTLAPSEYANIAAATASYAADGPPAGTILALTLTHNGSNQPVLTWIADPQATLYKVMRSTDGVNYTTIATPAVGTLTYTDTARPNSGTVYYHIVSTH